MAVEYADLTIKITRPAQGQYWVELSYTQPDGSTEQQPRSGEVRFDPRLRRAREFSSEPRRFRFLDVDGQWQELSVPPSGLAFTWCQVPIVYRLLGEGRATLAVTWQDGRTQTLPTPSLPAELSAELFPRSGRIRQISLEFPKELLLGE